MVSTPFYRFFNLEKTFEIDEKLYDSMQAVSSEEEAIDFLKSVRIVDFSKPWDKFVMAGIDDFLGIQRVLFLAAKLRNLVMLEKVTDSDLEDCGIRTEKVLLDDEARKGSGFEYGDHWLYYGRLEVKISGFVYSRWIKSGLENSYGTDEPILSSRDEESKCECGTFCYPSSDDNDEIILSIDLNPGFTDLDEETARYLFARCALDELFDIHLKSIRTETHCGIPYQTTSDGIAATWLSLGFKFQGARVIECKACSKPVLVSGERGTPREYCSDACRKWAQRHPGEKRNIRRSF